MPRIARLVVPSLPDHVTQRGIRGYIWSARYIDAPILRDRDADDDGETGSLGQSNSGLEERLYYLTDAGMKVTCLVDTGGDAVERYYYDPYGKVTFLTGAWGARASSSYDNSILYCGYYRDSVNPVNRDGYYFLIKWDGYHFMLADVPVAQGPVHLSGRRRAGFGQFQRQERAPAKDYLSQRA